MWSFGIRVTQRCGADRPGPLSGFSDGHRHSWDGTLGVLVSMLPPHLTGFTSKREDQFVTFPHHIGTRDSILMPAF